jgi:TonB-linked SusC/RagA family outer membrane protein
MINNLSIQQIRVVKFLFAILKKIPLRMKLMVFMLFLSVGLLRATGTYGQITSLTLEARNETVQQVLDKIEAQSEFSFFYNNKQVNVDRLVSINTKNQNVFSILNKLFDGTDVTYKVLDKSIILSIKENEGNTSLQEDKKVSGIVLDEKGEPVIGANVMVKGTTNGTVTDMDGKFVLSVPQKASLVISYIGYMDRTVLVGDSSEISVRLSENTQALEEVVVVGYGTQKKVNLTGSVSSVKFDEELANRPITDASQALSGKVSGVWISQNSGKPGDDGAQLRVRGWGTLNNTDPLVIIDGVEGEFSQVNPNDIESISVLKDAASAAIYGSKAANGVILVTTKTGNNNEKTSVELNSYIGTQWLGDHYDLVTNSAEHMTMANQAMTNNGSSKLFPETLIANFANGMDSYKYPNTDWYDASFENALITGHNLSIRSGTEKLSAFTSLSYLKQDGIMIGSDAARYGIRSNLDYKVNSWLKIGGRFSYTKRKAKEPFDLEAVHRQISGATPFIAPYTADGRFGSVQALDEDGLMLYSLYNPLIHLANGASTTDSDYLSLDAHATINFMKDLNLQVVWASNGSWKETDRYNETIYGYTDTGIEMQTKAYNKDGIVMSRKQISTMRNNFQATLNYSKRFVDKHYVAAVLGTQLENYSIKNVFARRTDPPKEGLTQVDSGTGGVQGEGNFEGLKMVSYFGRLNYSFADKYLFEMNLRADASSRFKRGNRWGVFPGFSAGWRLSEEAFIKNLNLFSNLKLRASWGQLGNQTIEGYWPYLTVIDQSYDLSYNYGGSLAPGAAVTALVDENITWETTSSLDIGVDLGFLNSRLNIEADYFNKKTTDIIVQLPIPNVLGDKTAPFENVGEMKNNGFELVVNYDNLETSRDRLGFNVGFNFTYIDNKVTKFQDGDSPDQLYLVREGYPYKALYGYKAIGIYQSDEEAAQHMQNNGFKPQMGNLKYEDVNNDGKLDYQDKQVLGNTIPKITYGISAGLRYKDFDLNVLFQGLGKANVFIQDDITRMSYEWMAIPTFWRDAWTPENSDSKIPMLRFDSSWDNYQSSFWTHRIDFLKLKNIQLGYAFPESITSKLKIQRLYVYANAQNLFTIMLRKGYEGYDPERNTFDTGAYSYPTPRIFTFGINLNF